MYRCVCTVTVCTLSNREDWSAPDFEVEQQMLEDVLKIFLLASEQFSELLYLRQELFCEQVSRHLEQEGRGGVREKSEEEEE